jgi:hypothetical protein
MGCIFEWGQSDATALRGCSCDGRAPYVVVGIVQKQTSVIDGSAIEIAHCSGQVPIDNTVDLDPLRSYELCFILLIRQYSKINIYK